MRKGNRTRLVLAGLAGGGGGGGGGRGKAAEAWRPVSWQAPFVSNPSNAVTPVRESKNTTHAYPFWEALQDVHHNASSLLLPAPYQYVWLGGLLVGILLYVVCWARVAAMRKHERYISLPLITMNTALNRR